MDTYDEVDDGIITHTFIPAFVDNACTERIVMYALNTLYT